MDQLQQLKQMTTVVADTGDIDAIRQFQPVDATTNPSLLLKAAQDAKYAHLLTEAREWARQHTDTSHSRLALMTDRFGVLIGREISGLIPGRISTEVDARLSFDTQATIAKAHQLIEQYEALGISRDRVLIKIASTWEGIEAGRQLEREGINCNLTLLFSFAQAQACADAGIFLISPFVGRILDWYKQRQPEADFSFEKDPGVQSVSRIYRYYKAHNYDTVVMGASFRNTGEIQALAGCDRLTISPALMQELADNDGALIQRLRPDMESNDSKDVLDESGFRWAMNEDVMAQEKLAEGIRNFASDQIKLESLLGQS
ncbi:transaldolase [Marinobacterium sediminicola]|uniref:Transaldolase n=1 Tax=Marinobacterium sediminicola TaxID=518898 RepID=A0ABY1RX11_9GAMM|nr:transaldolase [Marinobacterium sediminicola]ULG67912.1 transaldolase [Marinobacterium sediminicola]SMR71378.1 transaldolase [Marinobacterium sediminicola]